MTLASSRGALEPTRTVLAGVAVSQFGSAATSLVIFWSAKGDSYRDILTWLLGSLAGSTWATAATSTAVVVIVGVILLHQGLHLDAFAFGDASAASLGEDVDRVRRRLLVLVALLTGVLVSSSGAIGFVGLILPHMVSGLTGPSHRRLLPTAACAGAVFLTCADTLARTAFAPRELPVGVVTALVGVPVFALLLRRRGASAWR
jgi:iron complex transport system permease protein